MSGDSFYLTNVEELFPELLRPDVVLWWVEMKAATRVDWPESCRWSPDTEERE